MKTQQNHQPSVHHMLCLSVHLSVHRPYNLAIHCALRLSLHLSVHCLYKLCIMSVIAPIHASPILSIHPYDDKHQEFPDGFSGTKYGEKNPSEIMVKFPHDVTLTLQQAKFPEETPDTTNSVIYPGNFMSTLFQVKFMVINLRNYVLGVFQVTLHAMRCVHGSINKILLEWDPGPTYVVQRLWDPGGPTSKPKSYLDYIHLPGLSSLPFLVTVKPNLAPNNHLGKLDHMGRFSYLD